MSLLDKTKEQKLDEHGFQYKDWLDDRYKTAIDNLNSLNEYIDSSEKELKDCNSTSRLIKELR